MPRSLPVFAHILLRTSSLLVLLGLTLHVSGQNLTLTGLNPIRNARSAPTNTNVSVIFDQPIASSPASLSGLRVFSAQRGGLLVNGRGGSTSVSDRTLVFNPTTDFRPGETVFVTSTTAIQSQGEARLSRGQVYGFTTKVGGTGRGNFTPPATNPDPGVGEYPTSVALGDVDGDGDLDLLCANAGSSTVSVRLNNGSGNFTTPTTNPEVGVGNTPTNVALGDVDGDGDLDLLCANAGSNTVSVRLNNGSGNFTAHPTTPNPGVGGAPQSVALGDVDGDGDLDLLCANSSSNTVSVRLNDGSGNFTPPTTNPDPGVGKEPYSVALGDVDGDGYLDFVTANAGSNTVSVRLNDGSGNFTTPATNPDPGVGSRPYSVALGDVDGDGDLDLLCASSNNSSVSVRLNDGSGNFTPHPTTPNPGVGGAPQSVALGDVDGDGDLDLLCASSNNSSVSVRLNDGSGSFAPYPINSDPEVGIRPRSVALGDVDGDGDLDLLCANFGNATNNRNNVSVRLNGIFPATILTGLNPIRNARSAPTNTNVSVIFDQPIASSPASLSGLRVFSAQRGGLLVNGRGGSTSVSDRTLVFNPTTDFRPGETVFVTSTTAIQSQGEARLSRGQVYGFTTKVGGTGRGNFTPPATNPDPGVGVAPRSVALGDVDGDGDLDLLCANYIGGTVSVRLNNGSGNFTPHPTTPNPGVGNTPTNVALGDVDGDGDLDLLCANAGSNTVSVRLNDGSGNFTAPTANPNPGVGNSPTSVALGDVDRDGDLDLLCANAGNNTVSVRLNDGSGNFTPPATNPDPGVGSFPTSVALGDVDGDGDLDLLCANESSNTVSVRLNDGSGNFTTPTANPNPGVGNSPTSVALGDVDGDGDLDLLCANASSNTVSVRLNDGSGNFIPPTTNPNPGVGTTPTSVALGDVDGDGDLDLLCTSARSNTVSVRLNDGSGNFTAPPPSVLPNPNPGVGSAPTSVALGDVDGDGDLDLLCANESSNTVSVRLNGLLPLTLTGLATSPNPVCAGQSISVVATVGNLTGSYSYTLTNGSNPLSGTATASSFSQSVTASGTGPQTFTLTVGSADGRSTSSTTDLTVNPLPVASLTNNGPLSCTITSVTLTAGGGISYTFSDISGFELIDYPPGPTNTLIVSRVGFYEVKVASASGCVRTVATRVSGIGAVVTVSNPVATTATLNASFSQNFTASRGSGPYTYSLASGSLPPGLNLAANGTLSGTPTQLGSFTITVKATEVTSGCSGVSAAYVLQVASPVPIRYVRAGATGSGTSWADASGNLQAMINASAATDQVWVAAGTYKPTTGTDRTISFSMKNGVAIYGGFAGNETALNQRVLGNPLATILSGDIGTAGTTADNSYHVINNPPVLTNSAVLDGFLITGGNANGSNSPDDAGGGMINNGNGAGNNCSPLIRNCLFVGNSAANGGGAIYNAGFTNGTSSPSLINCAFQGNAAGQGGALFNDGSVGGTSSPQLTNCSFQTNSAPSGGAMGSVAFQGSSRPVLTNCVVWGNGGGSTFSNQQGAFITTSYSLFESSVMGYNAGTGNLTTTTSPFASATTTQLSCGSAAIDAGDPATTSATVGSIDLAGNPRFFSRSSGTPATIDMGAYEAQAFITITSPSASTVPVGVAFSQNFTASGGSGPYSYSLASGSLPPGLSLATTGVLESTPTQGGSFTITIKATDATGCSGLSAAYVLTVRVPSTPIRYVRAGASGSGNSWGDASGDLQSQIDFAGAQQVWVAAGTYRPTGTSAATSTDYTVSFSMKNGVAIYGGFSGSETSLSQRVLANPLTTILSGDIGTPGNTADNSFHVINNPPRLTNSAILDGFLITGGNANGKNRLSSNAADATGGGMLNNGSGAGNSCNPVIRNCLFVGNTATNGGGAIYNAGHTNGNSTPSLINCAFQGNTAGQGGAIYNNGSSGGMSSPVLTNCSFQGNSVSQFGEGVLYNNGSSGGMSSPVLTNCVLFNNGGGSSITNNNGSVTATNSLFEPSVTGYIDGGNNLTSVTINPFASTETVALNGCSPAINSGNNAAYTTANGPATDLAGNPRLFPSGGQIDMGAVESQVAPSSITPVLPSVNTVTVGRAFSQPFSASGGTSPYSYNVAGGSLPPGLSLATTGVLSGTPTQLGIFTITVQVLDATNCPGVSAPYVLTVQSVTPIRYVKMGGTGSGSSWADASGDLQAMIAASAEPDQVWVAAGTYRPTGTSAATGTDRTISFSMKNGVTIYGGFRGNETSLSQRPTVNLTTPSSSTLSGDIDNSPASNSGNSYHVIRNPPDLNTSAVVDGFVITGGNANGNGDDGRGGGMYNIGPSVTCSPTVLNCSFQGNTAQFGGAIYNYGRLGGTSNPVLTNCSFQGNTAEDGGAIYNYGSLGGTSNPVLTNCSFQSNSARSAGGAIYNVGSEGLGFRRSISSPILTNCSFQSNSARSAGGAIYNFGSDFGVSNPVLIRCSFQGNSASHIGGAITNGGFSNPKVTNCSFQGNTALDGGAIYNNENDYGGSFQVLTNCSFQGNSASRNGGAVYVIRSWTIDTNPALINCSFQSNSALEGGAIYNDGRYFDGTPIGPSLTNCVLFGNGGQKSITNINSGKVVVTYSLLESSVRSYADEGNNLTTIVSPFLSSTDARLNVCSPAINAGDNAANNTTTDLAGNPRFYRNGRIDMGAYEFQAAPTVITITVPGLSTATVGVGFSQDFTASGGSSPYSFSLASGSLPTGLNLATTGVLSGTPTQSGSYTITVLGRDATGCSGVSAAYVLTVTDAASPNPALTGLTASPGAVCVGSVATFTATVGNVTGSYSYTLTNGSNVLTGTATTSTFSQSITAAGTGTQSFTLTVSANGQSASSVTTLTVNPLPVASLTSSGPLSCTTTSVTLTAGGATGVPGNSYTFTSGSGVVGTPGPTNTLAVSTPGTYSVTVASASGCVSTTSTVVTTDQNVPTVSITPSSATLNCASPAVSLTAVGTGSVRWSTGETTRVISVSVAGPYSVTATGGNGCSAVASVSVSQDNSAPVASLVSSGSLTCAVTSVTLTASPNGLSYQFGQGASQLGTTNQATVSSPGLYSVTVVSASGCTATASTTVVGDQSVPVASLTNNGPLSCSATSVTLTASGGDTYRFSSGASQLGNSPTATVSRAGVYSVTVVSANGCSSVASTTVAGDQSVPTASLTNNGPLSCSTTSITLTASRGSTGETLSYQFSSGASQVDGGNTATVSSAGVYSVTVIGSNGCTATASTTVTGDQQVPSVSIAPSSATLTCASPTVSLTALGNGSVRWSTGETTSTISVSVAETYSVTLTGANSCTALATIPIQQDGAPPANARLSSGTLTCSQTSLTLTASASGGVSYRFSGGTPVGTAQVVVTTAGPYSVTITGANGCTSVASTTVEGDQSVPVAGLTNNGPLSCTKTSVLLTASGAGTYRFSAGATPINGGPTATVTTAGIYSVTVVGSNGCSSVASATVVGDQSVPVAGLTNDGPLSCTKTSVTLTASGVGTYQFSQGATPIGSGPTASVSTAGVYSVTVVGANGCSSIASTTVVGDQSVPTVSLTSSGPLACSGGTITLTALSTTPGATYRFSAGATQVNGSNTATVTTAGVYSVTAIAPNGCFTVASTTVTAATCNFAISGVTTVSCVVVDAARGQRQVTFVPQYSGLSGQPVTFSVTNELAATTAAGPYTLRLYSDNPVITLVAQQGGVSSTFSYNWLAACGGTVEPPVNTPPTVASVIPAQTASVGQPFSYVIPASTFSDAQTPTQLTLSVAGLPAGLSFTAPGTISGVATVTGVSTVQVTATDPGGLSASTSFQLSVTGGTVTPPVGFAISGVTTVSCVVVDAARGQRQVTFVPQYSGLSGQPVTFSVTNELAATTAAGPYTLRLYSDNPVITLVAQQGGVSSTFSYNWLAACGGTVEPPVNTPPTVASVIPAQTASVGQPFSYVIPASTFSDAQTPTQLTLSVAGLPAGLSFTAPGTISGVATVTGVSTVQVTATDPGGLSASTSFQLSVTGGTVTPPVGFAISGVTTVSCVVVDAARGQRQVTFVPQYSGLSGQPVTFSVTNELAATTAAGPYTLRLYSDNPVITLVAQQGGVSSTFSYNWLAACGGTVEPPVNTPPTVASVIPAQTASVGQPFSYVIPASTFSDAQTPTQLTLSVAGLPAGLSFTAPGTISGVATVTGVSTVQVTATDPGGLSASTSFQLSVTGGTVTPPVGFAISGVTTVSCVVVDAARGQRQVTFVPQYSGLSGQPVTFSVTNELAATTAAGPYTLRLYSDNPVITLVAQQGGVSSTFSYNWLAACGSSQGRIGVLTESTLSVQVLGNPIEGHELMLEVKGAQGQPLTVRVLDERGYPAAEPLSRPSAEVVERLALRLPGAGGVYVLQVSIPGQQQSVKVIKR